MICPKCGMEFQDWVSECTDCHVPLVEAKPSPERDQTQYLHAVKLTEVPDNVQLELIKDLLAQEGIQVLVKSPGSGGVMNIYMGYSIYGEEIYVDERDYPRAQEILSAIADVREELETGGEEPEDEAGDTAGDTEYEASKRTSRTMVRIVILFVATVYGLLLLARLIASLYAMFTAVK